MSGQQQSKKWGRCPRCRKRHWPKKRCDHGALLKAMKKP